MLLTIAWGGSLLLGRCDIDPQSGLATNRKLTKKKDLWGTGVTTDEFTSKGALIMMLSCLLYLSVQVPAFLGDIQDRRAALIGSGVCLTSLLAYSVFQVVYPELQRKRIAAARARRFQHAAVAALSIHAGGHGHLIDHPGHVNRDVARQVFNSIDTDENGFIDEPELRALLAGLSIAEGKAEQVSSGAQYWLSQMDTSNDHQICFDEFYNNVTKWARANLHEHRLDVRRPEDEASLRPLLEEGEEEEEGGRRRGESPWGPAAPI
eukprot:jgi/Botrbrau1/3587/Bobra.0078s0039.1